MTPPPPAKRGGLIPASPSKGQDHEPPKGGAAQSTFSTISDVVGEGFIPSHWYLTGGDKPRPYVAGWLVDSNQYINVGAHEIVSKITNATVSHGQTFRSPPPGGRPGGGFNYSIIILP